MITDLNCQEDRLVCKYLRGFRVQPAPPGTWNDWFISCQWLYAVWNYLLLGNMNWSNLITCIWYRFTSPLFQLNSLYSGILTTLSLSHLSARTFNQHLGFYRTDCSSGSDKNYEKMSIDKITRRSISAKIIYSEVVTMEERSFVANAFITLGNSGLRQCGGKTQVVNLWENGCEY